MSVILTIRDTIRDFLRKYDEFITPVLRFLVAFVIFSTINNMYGNAELFNKSIVVILVSIICGILPDGFMFFVIGIDMVMSGLSVSTEVGALVLVFFIAMYCMYIRFFPNYAYVLFIIPICYHLGLPMVFAAPVIIGLLAGFGGVIPAAFGVIMYYLSNTVQEIIKLSETTKFVILSTEEAAANETPLFTYVFNEVLKNKEMIAVIVLMGVVIVMTRVVYIIPFPYSHYAAILVGAITQMIAGSMISDLSGSKGAVMFGAVLAIVFGAIVQFCRGLLDYKHTEIVQYDDDDYFYYVKAVPKVQSEKAKAKRRRKKKPQADAAEA